MRVDVVLISTPNKNIDYPGLSLPILTGALRAKGIVVDQYDLNVTLRDRLLSYEGLTGLLETTLPRFAEDASGSKTELTRLIMIGRYLRRVRDELGFKEIEDVKHHAQERNFTWIFESDERFKRYLSLFKINRALHYIIDIGVCTASEDAYDFVTKEIQRTVKDLVTEIITKNPVLVGLSVLDIQRGFSLFLLHKLRESYEGCIAIGGADPTRFPKEYMTYCSAIDVLFVREAEASLLMLIDILGRDKQALESVPGILYRQDDSNIIETRHEAVDLSRTPIPDFRGLPLELYLTPALPLQASRGCYWSKCRFCIHWNTYSDFRMRDPEQVVEDMRTLVSRHNAKFFHFTDDSLPIHRAKEIVRHIEEANLDVRWLAYFRMEEGLTEEILNRIWRAGGRVLEMGLESASDRMLKVMRKNISVSNATRVVREAAKQGFLVKLFMFHGFPGETLEEAKMTVDFTETNILEGNIRPFLPLRNRFELLRGSDIYDSVVAGYEPAVRKFWISSGIFGIRSEYELEDDENEKHTMITDFVRRIRKHMEEKRIYNTDDDNVMLDLIVLEYSPIKAGWLCRQEHRSE